MGMTQSETNMTSMMNGFFQEAQNQMRSSQNNSYDEVATIALDKSITEQSLIKGGDDVPSTSEQIKNIDDNKTKGGNDIFEDGTHNYDLNRSIKEQVSVSDDQIMATEFRTDNHRFNQELKDLIYNNENQETELYLPVKKIQTGGTPTTGNELALVTTVDIADIDLNPESILGFMNQIKNDITKIFDIKYENVEDTINTGIDES